MKKSRSLKVLILTVAAAGLTACASWLGGEEVEVRPINTMSGLTADPRDPLYESAGTAINERDYGKALDYLQEAKARDPGNVKVLNALGVVYDKLGRFDLSARYYAQARAVDPGSRVVAANLNYSQALQGLMTPNQSESVSIPIDLQKNIATVREPMVIASALPPSVAVAEPRGQNTAIVSAPAAALPAVPKSDEAQRKKLLPDPVQPAPVPMREAMRIATVATEINTVKNASGVQRANFTITGSAVPNRPTAGMPANVAGLPSGDATVSRPPVEQSRTATAAGAQSQNVVPNALPMSQPKPVAEKRASALPAVPAIAPPQLRRTAAIAAGKKVLFIGQPVRILNASGKSHRVAIVSRRLSALGWTVKLTDTGRVQSNTTLIYNPRNVGAAKSMQRTLPFPIRLVAEPGVNGMRLVVGRDYLSWKTKNTRVYALWQKGPTVVSQQKAPAKGVL